MDNISIFDEPQHNTEQEYIAVDNVRENVTIPEIPTEEVHPPTSNQVTTDEQKSMKKIKMLKEKWKILKVLERFLKNKNILLKERNQKIISENDKLKEDQEKLQKEHELVCHQAFLWNKSRKELKKQNKKLQVEV